MSLNINTDSTNVTSQQRVARNSAVGGTRLPKRAADHAPDPGDAAPKPRSPAQQPDSPLMRTDPAASTDDSLQRLPDAPERLTQNSRARRKGPAEPPIFHDGQSKVRCPYDPAPTTQRDLDVLA